MLSSGRSHMMVHKVQIRRIAVLKGGWSPEREISLLSGANIAAVFREAGFETIEIDVLKDLRAITESLYEADPDYIFNALHGLGGEDGVIQGILEVFGKPYSGSGVLPSAIGFNKDICKVVALHNGIKTPRFQRMHDISEIDFEYPFIIKPACNGSSIGTFLVKTKEELKDIVENKWQYGNDILIEEFIPGREFTVCVSDGRAIGAVEIIFDHPFYDYDAKYQVGGSRHEPNFELAEGKRIMMFRASETMFEACKCKSFIRCDFRFDGQDFYFLEINTQPGLSSQSLVPDILSANEMNIIELLFGK